MDGFGCSGSVMLLVYVEMDVWWSLVGRGIAEDSSLDEEPIGFGWKSSYEKGFARSGHLELSPCHCKDRSDHVLLLDQEWVGIKNRILLLWPCFGEQVVKQGWLRAMSYPDWSRVKCGSHANDEASWESCCTNSEGMGHVSDEAVGEAHGHDEGSVEESLLEQEEKQWMKECWQWPTPKGIALWKTLAQKGWFWYVKFG